MATARKVRESSTRAKGSSKIRTAGPKINKSNSVGNACVLINVVDIEVAKELVADEIVAEEDDAKVGAADEVAADLAEHVAKLGRAMEGIVNHATRKLRRSFNTHISLRAFWTVAYVSLRTFWQISYVFLWTFWTVAYISLTTFWTSATADKLQLKQ
ncbi:unnamed protein product [Prunus brigantina]